MADLAERECVPCRGGVPPLKGGKIEELLPQLEGWQVVDEHHLQKFYRFKDFRESLQFVPVAPVAAANVYLRTPNSGSWRMTRPGCVVL